MSDQQNMPKEMVEAIAAMMVKVGYIQKKGENKFHGYKYASIEDVLDKVQPALAECGLVITQDELCHNIIADGQLMEATYAFGLAHKSGATCPPIRHTGLAALRNTKGGYDDKALNKCHTAARKYFILGLFQIPTGLAVDPDEDEDKPHHEPAPRGPRAVEPAAPSVAGRKIEADGIRKAREWVNAEAMPAIKACKDAEALNLWHEKNAATMEKLKTVLPEEHQAVLDKIAVKADSFNVLSAAE